MKKLLSLSLLIPLIFQFGCGVAVPLSYNKDMLFHLKIKMTQDEVRSLIGNPDEVRGSIKNEDGDIVTVWQYELYAKSSAWKNLAFGIFPFFTLTWWAPSLGNYNRPDSYWLYFVTDKLAQWGRAGDWQPDVIMKIKIDND